MNARDQLLLTYAHLQDGQDIAGERCPSCYGGSTGENTLSVSKKHGQLLWYCHRASCSFRGSQSTDRQPRQSTTEKVQCRGVVGRALARESQLVANETAGLLQSRYGITESHLTKYAIGWDEATGRLCVPVQNFRGDRTGVVLRTLSGQVPKTLTHTEQGAMSWFTNHTATGVIIVEDQFSAIRASSYLTAVALLGTHLNDDRVEEIKRSKLTPVFLALDADAWPLAVKYAVRYRQQLKPQLIRLTKDIKDMTDTELREVLK